jgi:hypothetical protein
MESWSQKERFSSSQRLAGLQLFLPPTIYFRLFMTGNRGNRVEPLLDLVQRVLSIGRGYQNGTSATKVRWLLSLNPSASANYRGSEETHKLG